MAKKRGDWTQLWNETHSSHSGLSEEQVQAALGEPGP